MAPPSLVSKLLECETVQTEARLSSTAFTPPKSSFVGEVSCFQCLPRSVVSSTVPAFPTTQQTFPEVAEPAVRSVVTPLFCSIQVRLLSVLCSIFPLEPTRQE